MPKLTYTLIAAAGIGCAIWVYQQNHDAGWVALTVALAALITIGRTR